MTAVGVRSERITARTAATATRLALGGTLAGAVLGVGYFTVGGVFAPLSDGAAAVFGLALAPVVVHVWERSRQAHGRLADASLVVGLGSAAVIASSSFGLILQDTGVVAGVGRAALTAQFVGMAAAGGWLLCVRGLARRSALFSRRVAAAAGVAGWGYLVVGLAEPLTGFRQLTMYSAGGVAIVAFSLWAVWAARELDAGT